MDIRVLVGVSSLVIAVVACSSSGSGTSSSSPPSSSSNKKVSNCNDVLPSAGVHCACDSSVSVKVSIGTYSCESTTSAVAFQCQADDGGDVGTWTKVFTCPGMEVCHMTPGNAVECPPANGSSSASGLTYASAGTPCGSESAAACSYDATSVVICRQGVWKTDRTCSPKTCSLTSGGLIGCR